MIKHKGAQYGHSHETIKQCKMEFVENVKPA